MPTADDHWSREPGRWESTLAPAAYATIPRVATPCPSPDGHRIAFSRGYDGRSDLMVVDAIGGFPLQLTDRATLQSPDPEQRHASSIAWTPDGEHLVFAAKDGKLWLVSAAGGPSRAIDEAAGNHHSPAVSPDGRRVAYVAERDEEVDVFVADLDGGAVRRVSTGDERVLEPRWSPDGSRLLYGQWPRYDMPWDELAVVVASANGQGHRVVAGGACVTNEHAVWSPDGSRIAFVSDREGDFLNLTITAADGGTPERPVPDAHDHASPAWSADGRRIAYLRNVDGDVQVWLWDGAGARQLTDEPGVHADPTWLDADHLVCVFQSPLRPPDLCLIGVGGAERRQLTQSATGGVLGGGLRFPESLPWTSDDGLEIHGHLLTPDEACRRPGRHPLVVSIHGGPVGQARLNWQPHLQHLLLKGYVVLTPNYRGSTGYGRPFMERLYGDWGGGDLADNLDGVGAVIAQGLVDPRRVVAMGGSAGGYSTLICLAKAPDVFKAGVCRYGVADLRTFGDTTWVFERHYVAKLMGGPGGARPELYADRSPITHAATIQAPILVLQGDDDLVCHPSQMDGMVAALERLGKDVEYHRYPDEGHGWSHVSTMIDDAERIDDFLTRKVLNR